MGFKFFVKSNRLGIFAILGISLIFFAVFYAYSLPIEAVIYPVVLSLIYLLVLVVFYLIRQKKKHDELCELFKKPAADIMYGLKNPESIIEKDYETIIGNIIKEYSNALDISEIQARDMKDYYATWAHQIKTPIASMRLNLHGEDSPLARTLLNNLQSIECYVDMVMTYVRLNSEHSDFVIEEENIKVIVTEAIRKQKTIFIEKHLSVSVDVDDVFVLTDRKWVSIIIEQILSNALKYTNAGGVTFSFDKETNALSIKDTGIGIEKENLPRIFEKGYTGFNGRVEAHSSGIGLYISKKIADSLSIDVKCESAVNEGTVMILTFPINNPNFD